MRINRVIAKGQFHQIFSTNSVRKFMENRPENLYGGIGASRVKLKSTIISVTRISTAKFTTHCFGVKDN